MRVCVSETGLPVVRWQQQRLREMSFSLIKDEDKCAVNTCTRLNALFESTHPHKEHNEMHTVYVILCNAHVPRQIPKHARCLVG